MDNTSEARDREFSRLVAVELVNEAKAHSLRQKDVAIAAGITPEQLSAQVHGRKGLLTVGILLRGAERIGVNPSELVERAYARLGGAVVEDVIAPPDQPEDPASDSMPPRERRGEQE